LDALLVKSVLNHAQLGDPSHDAVARPKSLGRCIYAVGDDGKVLQARSRVVHWKADTPIEVMVKTPWFPVKIFPTKPIQ
jgi:hypothetical protein